MFEQLCVCKRGSFQYKNWNESNGKIPFSSLVVPVFLQSNNESNKIQLTHVNRTALLQIQFFCLNTNNTCNLYIRIYVQYGIETQVCLLLAIFCFFHCIVFSNGGGTVRIFSILKYCTMMVFSILLSFLRFRSIFYVLFRSQIKNLLK